MNNKQFRTANETNGDLWNKDLWTSHTFLSPMTIILHCNNILSAIY